MRHQRNRLGLMISAVLMVTVLYWPAPAFSQQDTSIQDLIINGGFEGGFQQEYGIGYGWGGFSNGNAVVGWSFDDWEAVVPSGKYSQRLEIQDALEQNRYVGIYQTISVVPGQQYKLTLTGLIRSEEGDIALSDYGYRLQYAVDYKGGTAWELLPDSEWKELPWDEQPMTDPSGGTFRTDTTETTITAQNEKLTLFIRGWKKWINQGSGVFNLDEISFVGPAPEGFQSPVAQAALVNEAPEPAPETEATLKTATETEAGVEPVTETEVKTEVEAGSEPLAEAAPDQMVEEPQAAPNPGDTGQVEAETETEAPSEFQLTTQNDLGSKMDSASQPQVSVQTGETAPQTELTTLPVSGYGDDSLDYVLMSGIILLSILLVSAIAATLNHRNMTDPK